MYLFFIPHYRSKIVIEAIIILLCNILDGNGTCILDLFKLILTSFFGFFDLASSAVLASSPTIILIIKCIQLVLCVPGYRYMSQGDECVNVFSVYMCVYTVQIGVFRQVFSNPQLFNSLISPTNSLFMYVCVWTCKCLMSVGVSITIPRY